MRANIKGIKIDYRDQGTGVPVVFIHAFPLNQSMWDDQVTAISSICRTITLDLRGFGSSDVPDGPYSMDQMAADVRGLVTELGINKPVLVGLSMGGYISFAFYRNYPDAVRAMVLADTRASADTEEGREKRIESAERAEREGARAIADDMVSLALAPSTVENHPDVVQRMREMAEANSPKGIAAAQRGMARRRDSRDLLAQISFPVQIIAGSEDKLTSVREAESMRDGIPNARFQTIEGAGHLSNLERPREFNSVLVDFIKSLK